MLHATVSMLAELRSSVSLLHFENAVQGELFLVWFGLYFLNNSLSVFPTCIIVMLSHRHIMTAATILEVQAVSGD